jgi:L-threonate 2-dehydrogenase
MDSPGPSAHVAKASPGWIGIVGVGNMGLAIATRLLALGWRVAVRDVDASREAIAQALGARVCASPSALAEGAACVIVCVVDADQTESVLFDPKHGVAAQSNRPSVVLCPTIAPDATEGFAARLGALGMACIDAPMSGGPLRAREGRMSLMVACSDAAFDAHTALLNDLAQPVFRVGTRAGDGARTKLVNNLLAAINLGGAAQALALAERVGLDPTRTLEVIEQSSGQSWIGSDRLHRALGGDLAPRAHTSLLEKDARLALRMASACGFNASVGAAAAALFNRACEQGMAGLDDACLFEMLRPRPAPN